MRADRLINLLILLQTHGKMTSQELASRLEVSKRTIQRDMEALEIAGIPIVSERGKYGGWQLLDGFRSRLSGMTLTDIQSLFVSPSPELLADLGLADQTLEMRQKLIAAAPLPHREKAQAIWERIHIDTGTWRQTREKNESLHTILEAVLDEKQLTMHYETASGSTSQRTVCPLGLVAKGNRWYLVAIQADNIKSYRIARITNPHVLTTTFSRPSDFDLVFYWNQAKRDFIRQLPRYHVTAEVDPALLQRITYSNQFVRICKIGSPLSNQWVPVTLQFAGEAEAITYIVGYGDRLNILTPSDLQQKIITKAQAVIRYQCT